MADFELINTEEEYKKYERKVLARGGIHAIEVCNKPDQFPSVICNTLVRDSNGIRAILKHLNKKQIEEFFKKL
tara:strand:+ start:1103 stop:1321 length:219 start_codon:yes stop_codon:yes gene_type:complete